MIINYKLMMMIKTGVTGKISETHINTAYLYGISILLNENKAEKLTKYLELQ